MNTMNGRMAELAKIVGWLGVGLLALVGVLELSGRVVSAQSDDDDTRSIVFNLQGVLRDADGELIENGEYDLTFRLYDQVDASIDSAIWSEQQQGVIVRDGRFSASLGTITPLATNLFEGTADRYVGVTVAPFDEMVPRQRIASVPYAINASLLSGRQAADFVLVDGGSANNLTVIDATLEGGAINDGTINDGVISGGAINNTLIGQTTPAAGTFTNLQFTGDVQLQGDEGPMKPFFFQRYNDLRRGPQDNLVYDTGIPSDTYACGIAGFYSFTDPNFNIVRATANSDTWTIEVGNAPNGLASGTVVSVDLFCVVRQLAETPPIIDVMP